MHRFIFIIFLMSGFILTVTVETRSQTDWKKTFPEIPGCSRTIEALERTESVISQRAVYRREYGFCGSISIRVVPGIRASREKWKSHINTRRYKIRGFDAWSSHPWCGTPPAPDSIEVHFGEDAVLEVDAFEGYGQDILTFPQRADYALLLRLLNSIK